MAWFRTSLLVVIMAIGILLPALAMAEQSLEFRIVEDVQNEVATQNACCSAIAEYKTSKPGRKLRFGYGEPAKWVKLENVPGGGILRFIPVLDKITLYTRSGADDGWDAAITGDLVASNDKPLLSPFMAFPLPVDVDVNAIYARIEQGAAVSVTADHWSTTEFHLMQERDRTVRMFLIGFVCSIILYNLVMSFLVADLTFAANALTIVSMGVCALYLSGYGVIHVWPSWFAATNWIFCAAIASAICFGAIFTALFLKLWGSSLQTFWPLVIGPAVAILCFTTALFLNLGPGKLELAMLSSAMTFLICMSFIVARLAIRGNAEARILMFPLLFAVVPGLIMVALDKISGIDPFGLRGNYMEVTLASEAVMFSLALASRIRIAEMAASRAAVQLMEARDRNAATVLAAQDNERKRLATEIHDNIGQELLVMVGRVKQFAARRGSLAPQTCLASLWADCPTFCRNSGE
ncbi:MAG: 7TM diverse intracellular signaling domain-containing protein [Nitratireductor sp.]